MGTEHINLYFHFNIDNLPLINNKIKYKSIATKLIDWVCKFENANPPRVIATIFIKLKI